MVIKKLYQNLKRSLQLFPFLLVNNRILPQIEYKRKVALLLKLEHTHTLTTLILNIIEIYVDKCLCFSSLFDRYLNIENY
jgi:hypothetical protein